MTMEEKVAEAGGDHDPPASTSSSYSQEELMNDAVSSSTLEYTDMAGSLDTTDAAESVKSADVASSQIPSKQSKESESPMMSRIATIKQQAKHMRSESFQKWRRQMQRAWRWGPSGWGGAGSNSNREEVVRATVNFEAMANQKRMWYQIYSKSRVLRIEISRNSMSISVVR
jgi:hypothetical protein